MKNINIDLSDFPDDMYILLDEDFRANFFKTAWKLVGGYRKLAKDLNVSKVAMLSWRRGKQLYPEKPQFCPLWAIKKISNLLKENSYSEFKLKNIQKYVKAYRARAGSLIVKEPKLPILGSIELGEIVTHLICDGSASLIAKRTSRYSSTCKNACEEFLKKTYIFGKILRNGKEEIKILTGKGLTKGFRNKYISPFPKAITKILCKRFHIIFGTFDSRIPKEFFKGERLFLVSILRAFLIDEGNIKDTRIYFTSANLKLLKDLMKICNLLGYKYGKIEKKRTVFQFCISTSSFKQFYTDIMNTGILPIEDKQKRLESAIMMVNSSINFSKLDKNILKLLSRKPATITELSSKLYTRGRSIWYHLKKLEKKRKVKVVSKRRGKGGASIWSLN